MTNRDWSLLSSNWSAFSPNWMVVIVSKATAERGKELATTQRGKGTVHKGLVAENGSSQAGHVYCSILLHTPTIHAQGTTDEVGTLLIHISNHHGFQPSVGMNRAQTGVWERIAANSQLPHTVTVMQAESTSRIVSASNETVHSNRDTLQRQMMGDHE